MLLQSKDAQIMDLKSNLGRSNNVIHYFEVENKKLEAQKEIYEIRAIRAQKEAAKAKAKKYKVLDRYGNTDDKE